MDGAALAAGLRFAPSALAQASATDWADIEGRIQYAYYTNDARALNSVLASLKPKAVEGEEESGGDDAITRSYFRALAHYRLAQVLTGTQEVAGQGRHRRLRRRSRRSGRRAAEGAARSR